MSELNLSTTEKGNAFREHVLALLRSKYPDAHAEGKAEWKNADVIFTMLEWGKRIKVAVECKNYKRALTTSDFAEIESHYHTAFDKGSISHVLIVANRPIEAASRQLIESSKILRFMTLGELESWLVGLRPYVEALVDEFEADEIHKYYVEGRFENGGDSAFKQVTDWIASESNTGLAVLGGYGLGKSSLAKRVASAQASRYLKDPESERLPILLPLGQVVHETELAGLFGKHFTSHYALENYSYKTLLQLNSAGKLLIILDGFDEMKHAMTEHDFRANFREFNKLRAPRAKVLLLGRPNALTSESSQLLIRGLSEVAGQTFVNTDFPPWLERKLSFFTPDEQRSFLNGFLRVKRSASETLYDLESRINEVMNDIDEDILQRPVQARIVGLLAADPSYTFKNTNRYRLYEDFVKLVIQRDQEKRARSVIPAQDRHKFVRELAWWAWTRPGVSQGTFRREDVPDSLFHERADGHATDFQAKRTEYLVSSLTEEKDSNFLYFAHRSFHEFLVASYITSQSNITNNFISELSMALTEEVLDFLSEVEDKKYIEKIYQTLGFDSEAFVSIELIELLQSSKEVTSLISQKSVRTLTSYDIFILDFADRTATSDKNFLPWLANVLVNGSPKTADAAGFIFTERIIDEAGDELFTTETFLACAWERILSKSTEVNPTGLVVEEDKFCNIGNVLRAFTIKSSSPNGKRISLDCIRAHNFLVHAMTLQKMIGYLPIEDEKVVIVNGRQVELKMSAATAARFKEVLAQRRDEFLIVKRLIKPDVERKKRRNNTLNEPRS
jgi:hypothetical protein